MTWTIKQRPHVVGAPMTADYECPKHGRFELLVERDANGDPPSELWCPVIAEAAINHCGRSAPWRISAPSLKRDSVPCFAAVRGGDTERRPGMLDTRPLAEGMPMSEWKAKQRAGQQERRHHQLIKRGLKTRRVQVGG